MKQLVAGYRAAEISLHHLVAGIEGLINSLDIDENLRNEFWHAWGVLEDVRAYLLDEEMEEPSEYHCRLINGACRSVVDLVNSNEGGEDGRQR